MDSSIKIKNSVGKFVDFLGVRKTLHSCYLSFTLDNNEIIVASLDHVFIIDGQEIVARDLNVFDSISSLRKIIDIEFKNQPIALYDPVGVLSTSAFIHDNDIVSHNCDFIGSSNTLISSQCLLGLSAIDYIKLHNDVKYYEEPMEGKEYIMLVDVSKGRGQDYSTFNVIDVSTTPFNQVAVYRNNNISPLLFPDIIVRVAKLYDNALVLIENNDAGHIVCNAVYHEYEYENVFVESAVKALGVGVTMTKRVKRIGCSNLKDIVESGKLKINDAETITELSSFESKGGSYEASGNTNDDLVMNLVLFAWFISTDMFQDSSAVNLKDLLFSDRLKEMDDDVIPFGILHQAAEETVDMSHYHAMIAAQREWGTL